MYCDTVVRNDVHTYVCHKGYISLFPFMTGFIGAPLRHARPTPRLQPPLDGPRHSQPKPRKQKVRRRRQLLALAHLDQHKLHDHRAAATPRANTRAAATSIPRDIRRVAQQRRAHCVFVVAADRVLVGAVRSRWRKWTADAALYGLDGAGGEDHGYARSGAWIEL
jgi:hypothetical protein